MNPVRRLALPVLLLAATACSDVGPTASRAEPQAAVFGVGGGLSDGTTIQAALDEAAASNAPAFIKLAPGAYVALDAPLRYTGLAVLRIEGSGATIEGPASGNAIESTGGADLYIDDLTVTGAGEHGVYVEVPAGRTATQRVDVSGSILSNNGFAGLWIDDQVHDSPAGLAVRVARTEVLGNNIAGVGVGDDLPALADKDGIRINEGGPGDLSLDVLDSWFEGNEADALELDETGDGDVHARVWRTSFVDNGAQRQFPEDLEDGFDIDEAGDGSIFADLRDVYVTGHQDEGIDLDELDAGSVHMTMLRVTSLANRDDNVSVTESEEVDEDDSLAGEGDIIVRLRQVDLSERNDDGDGDGLKLEEFGAGQVDALVEHSRIANNDDDGIQIDEDGGDGGLLRLILVILEGNLDDDVNSDVPVVTIPQG